MNFTAETGHTVAPQFVSHGIPNIDTLDKNCRIWSPATRIIRAPNITHQSASTYAVGQGTSVGDADADNIKGNYKTDFGIWNKNYKLQNEHKILK